MEKECTQKDLDAIIHNHKIKDSVIYITEVVFKENIDLGFLYGKLYLRFKKCTFEGNFKLRNSSQHTNLNFTECTFLGSVNLCQINSDIDNCTFEKDFNYFLKDNTEFRIPFNGNKFQDIVELGCNENSIYIKEFNDETNKIILKGTLKSIFIGDSNINEIQVITHNSIQAVDIINCKFKSLSGLFTNHIDIIILRLCTVYENLTIGLNHSITNLRVDDCNFGILSFYLNKLSSVEINASFKGIQLEGKLNSNSKFHIANINDLKTERDIILLSLDNVRNYGDLKISGLSLNKNSKLILSDSDLKNINISNCNFDSNYIDYSNTNLSDSFLSETTFNKVRINENYPDRRHKSAKEFYSQLAVSYSKHGDGVKAQECIAQEMKHYFKSLNYLTDFQTKFNLLLNFLSNGFGVSWFKGVRFTFIIGFLFYCLLLITTKEYKFGLPSLDLDLTPAFIRFMNPIRLYELEKLFGDSNLSISKWSFVVDFIGRIFIAYGYYQTIQAFRRFGKR